jgi:1-pyrroline-5-carboxylate dehydrogenase
MNGFFKVPVPVNEPILTYAPGTSHRAELKAALEAARNQVLDIPMYIGANEVRTGNTINICPPHDHQHKLAHFHVGDASHVEMAIDAALAAKSNWENLAWEQRAAIFLKAADLIAGPYRAKLNAATM